MHKNINVIESFNGFYVTLLVREKFMALHVVFMAFYFIIMFLTLFFSFCLYRTYSCYVIEEDISENDTGSW